MNVSEVLELMRADCVPADKSGRWMVKKVCLGPRQSLATRALEKWGEHDIKYVPPGSYTYLMCRTMAGNGFPHGDDTNTLVMNDFEYELRKHLEFIHRASGHVLVGGLGLGCVVRGLLCNPNVERIDVCERERDVIALCGRSIKDPRVNLYHRSAEFMRGEWDWIWWDLWDDPERSESHLQVIHMDLVKQFADRCRNLQGCWAMPRKYRRLLGRIGVML